MNDPKLDYKNEFPVELVNPDISPYKNSNTGIDYIIPGNDDSIRSYAFFCSAVSQAIKEGQ